MKVRQYPWVLGIVTGILCVHVLGQAGSPLSDDGRAMLIARPHPELAGIECLRFGIVTPETEAKEAKKDGLVWKELMTKVERRLKEVDIEIGHPFYDGLEPMPLGLRVEINILKLKDSQEYVFRIQTSLARAVYLTKHSSWVIPADVWQTEPTMQVVSIKDMPDEVTNVVLEQVEAFIIAWVAANPQGVQPPDANDTSTVSVITPREASKQPAKQAVTEYKYVASKNSRVFHTPDCRWAKKIKPENRLTYRSRDEAVRDGKRPCKWCKP